MASVIIEYEKGKGFELNESFFELTCSFICETFEKKGFDSKPDGYKDIYEDFEDTAKGITQGFMGLMLNDYLNNEKSKKEELIDILEETKRNIQHFGKEIKNEELNRLEKRKISRDLTVNWNSPLKTGDFINVLEALSK